MTAKGAGIAIQRYLSPDDPPRVIVPLAVSLDRVLDLRGDVPATGSVPSASVVWQNQRAKGMSASTWEISDNALLLGAQAILYRSRSQPEIHHLVLLGPTAPSTLRLQGPAEPWPRPWC